MAFLSLNQAPSELHFFYIYWKMKRGHAQRFVIEVQSSEVKTLSSKLIPLTLMERFATAHASG